jgi:hypothetical protein
MHMDADMTFKNGVCDIGNVAYAFRLCLISVYLSSSTAEYDQSCGYLYARFERNYCDVIHTLASFY